MRSLVFRPDRLQQCIYRLLNLSAFRSGHWNSGQPFDPSTGSRQFMRRRSQLAAAGGQVSVERIGHSFVGFAYEIAPPVVVWWRMES